MSALNDTAMDQATISFAWLQTQCTELGMYALASMPATGPLDPQPMQQLLKDGVGDMTYLIRQANLRSDPDHVLPGYRNILVCALPYQSEREDQDLKRARYAAGKDYHKIFRKKLSVLAQHMNKHYGHEFESRAAVDSAPLNERALAQRAGLGWIGKNALLIHPKHGSYHFLGYLLTNAPLPTSSSGHAQDRCGKCTSCVDACPTQALQDRRVLSERCISYLTIEHKGVIPRALAQHFQGWWYGCDICQEQCPWNRFAGEAGDARLCGNDNEHELLQIRAENFTTFRSGRALNRISYEQFRRNLLVALWSLDRHQECQDFADQDLDLVNAQKTELGL